MTRTAIIAVLLIAFSMCFAQTNQEHSLKVAVDSLEARQNAIKNSMDSLNSKFLSDKFITLEVLEKSQKFYSDSFYWLIGILAIAVTVLAFFTFISLKFSRDDFKDLENKLQKKLNSELKEQKESLDKFIEETNKKSEKLEREAIEKLKEEIREILESDVNKIQEKSDTSFRFMSRIYRRLADDHLKKDNFHEYFYYIHIFYRCLIRINELNKYDLDRLKRTRNLFIEKNTNTKRAIKLENTSNICWYILHLLKFTDRCYKDNKLNEYFVCVKLIFNDIFTFNFNGFASDKETIEELKKCMENDKQKDTEVQEILELFNRYRDSISNPPPI